MVETEFVPEHEAPHILVDKCDEGPLSFTFQNNTTPSIWTDYSQMVRFFKFEINLAYNTKANKRSLTDNLVAY